MADPTSISGNYSPVNIDAIIVTDSYEPREFLPELRKELISQNLSFQVISLDFFPSKYNALKKRILAPHLLYLSTSIKIEDPRSVLEFHRANPTIPIVFDRRAEVLTVNPSLFTVLDDGRPFHTGYHFNLNYTSHRRIPDVEPPLICVLAHNRHLYLELALNSLVFSFGEYLDQVPVALLLTKPTLEVTEVAKRFLYHHKNWMGFQLAENAGLAFGNYAVQIARTKGFKSVVLYEDDFILPATVKDLYPAWPWLFADKLKYFDTVNWAPSLDNLTTPYRKYIVRGNIHSIIADEVDRPANKLKKWFTTFDSSDLFACGNGMAFTIDFYRECARSNPGYTVVDRSLENAACSRAIPNLYGYHIGWNQEQDGYPNLNSNRWEPNPEQTSVRDLRNNETIQLRLQDI